MLIWIIEHRVPLLSTLGLMLDISGAWVIALDVLRVFRGPRYEHERNSEEIMVKGLPRTVDGASPEVTTEYNKWQVDLKRVRKRGLYLLTAGFTLQAIAFWL